MIVLDTSALSALVKIQHLHLLKLFGDKIIIPSSVRKEIKVSNLTEGVNWSIIQVARLNKKEKTLAEKLRRRCNLGQGEAEVLTLCKLRDYSRIIDERTAARVAEILRIQHTGAAELKEKDNFYLTPKLI